MDIAPCPPFLKTQHQTFEFCNTQATVAIEPEAQCMTMENIAHHYCTCKTCMTR
jgi:hypothetical protein